VLHLHLEHFAVTQSQVDRRDQPAVHLGSLPFPPQLRQRVE
jgi:hypothetical protein